MRLDSVFQLQALNTIMREQFSACEGKTVMILGVAVGNGLEHINRHRVQRVYGVDINPEYLRECQRRYPQLEGILQTVCADLTDPALQLPRADALIANLLIEYIGSACFQGIVERGNAEEQAKKAKAKLNDVAPMPKNMERLAAEFPDDPERVLPEPGPLESAKSYREKKAKPVFEKIVKVLYSVYRAYLNLKRRYERLQEDYGRVRASNERLSDRLQEVKQENGELHQVAADYERVRQAFGPEQVDAAVETARQGRGRIFSFPPLLFGPPACIISI